MTSNSPGVYLSFTVRAYPDYSAWKQRPNEAGSAMTAFDWMGIHGITNAYIERFNRTFRHEVLDAFVFESLRQVRQITRDWIQEYNEERPHDSLGKIPPEMSVGKPKWPPRIILRVGSGTPKKWMRGN